MPADTHRAVLAFLCAVFDAPEPGADGAGP